MPADESPLSAFFASAAGKGRITVQSANKHAKANTTATAPAHD